MKSKLILLILVFFSFTHNPVEASEQNADWISVEYADLEHNVVSEYQLVTVSVNNSQSFLKKGNYAVDVDYDEDQLELTNVIKYDWRNSKTSEMSKNVTNLSSNFKVSYQFYLKPNVAIDSTQLSITVFKDGSLYKESQVNLNTHSYTSPTAVSVGDSKLSYYVNDYQNDGTEINMSITFDIIENNSLNPLKIKVMKNNMSSNSTEGYKIKCYVDNEEVEMSDKNQFEFSINEAKQVRIEITAKIVNLSSKNDRFEFFLFIEQGDGSVRLEPTFFRSEQISSGNNLRTEKYIKIKNVIAIFFIILLVLALISRLTPLLLKKLRNKL